MKNHSNRKPITFANNRFASNGNDGYLAVLPVSWSTFFGGRFSIDARATNRQQNLFLTVRSLEQRQNHR